MALPTTAPSVAPTRHPCYPASWSEPSSRPCDPLVAKQEAIMGRVRRRLGGSSLAVTTVKGSILPVLPLTIAALLSAGPAVA